MNEAIIRGTGIELRCVAARLDLLAVESWKLYEQLKAQLEGADPASPEGCELEALVMGLGRCIPGRARAGDLMNHAMALQLFPLSRKLRKPEADAATDAAAIGRKAVASA